MKHVLSLSTLYPNAVNPRFGTFVARSLEALEAACDEIIAKERESMRLEHTGDEPTPMITRIILWFMCLGYFLYAWNLQNVRESLGVNPHAGDTRVDAFQRALATLCMMSTSLLVITGKKN